MRRELAGFLRERAPRVWHSLVYWRYLSTSAGEPEIHQLDRFVDPNRIAVDVGVHLGFYTRRLAGLAKAAVGFEANPDNAALARRTLDPAITIHAVALSDRGGEAVMRIPTAASGAEALGTIADNNDLSGVKVRNLTVPMKRLDDFELPPTGFVKIDVEGHEEAVLDGAKALLARDRPVFMIEVEERHNPGSTIRVPEFFRQRGYAASFFDGQRIRPLAELNPGTGAHYVNNFFFEPSERAP